MFQYRDILVRLRQGESIRAIRDATGVGRPKITHVRRVAEEKGWLSPEGVLPPDEALALLVQPPKIPSQMCSAIQPYAEEVTRWAAARVPVTAIHAALKRNHGFTGSYGAVLRFVQRLTARKHPKAFVPLQFEPGEAAQVDFGAGPLLVDPNTHQARKSWFFVMTLCFSRHQFVTFVFDQTVATWLTCHRTAFEFFGGVPRKIIIDNLKAAISKACLHDPEVQRSYYAFAEAYGFVISPCRVATPHHKGRVESGVGYVKSNFLPTRAFRDIEDTNRQVLAWCVEEAGQRLHGRTHEKPIEMFAVLETSTLLPLPSVPFELATWKRVTVHPDCHVVWAKAYYSVPFRLVGKTLWLRATDTTVQLFLEHAMVAIHPRVRKPGTWQTLQDHLPPDKRLWLMKTPAWCREVARRIGPACLEFVERLLTGHVDRLRAVQGVLRLGEKFGNSRLEAACQRALHFDQLGAGVVKRILAKGLDLEAETAPPLRLALPEPKFARQIHLLLNLQHEKEESA